MCRIDQRFNVLSLDEKDDPIERFVQALDEYNVDEPLRSLLMTHLSNNYKELLSGFGRSGFYSLENILKEIQNYIGKEKCTAFFASELILKDLNTHFSDYLLSPYSREKNRGQVFSEMLFEFAKTDYADSLYQLYSNLRMNNNTFNIDFRTFASKIYDEDYFLSETFFSDCLIESLLENDRNKLRWNIFTWFTTFRSYEDKHYKIRTDDIVHYLLDAIDPEKSSASLSSFLKGFEFLKKWVDYESKARRLFSPSDSFVSNKLDEQNDYIILPALDRLYGSQLISEEDKTSVENWWDEARHRIKIQIYSHANLSEASDEQKEQWGSDVDRSFYSYYFGKSCHDDNKLILQPETDCLRVFCREMGSIHIETWVESTINQDIQTILKLKEGSSSLYEFDRSQKWCTEEHKETWKEKLTLIVSLLDIKDQLTVFSKTIHIPFSSINLCEIEKKAKRDCTSYLRQCQIGLASQEHFPKKLLPRWYLVSHSHIDSSKKETYLVDCIGILRGEMSSDPKPCDYNDLKELLALLECVNPSKAMRQRLLLMRAAPIPLTDQSLSLRSCFGSNSKPEVDWYLGIDDVCMRYAAYSRINEFADDYRQAQFNASTEVSKEFVEFCLGRLLLRKGEKASKEGYTEGQVVEKSSIWRQGYLKALEALGFNLNGKIHKTVNFISKSDPDKDVRAIAKSCYKTIRRGRTESTTIKDIRRGLIAAEWWLLLYQREELGEKVDYEEAKQTRRRLLRKQ